VKPKPPFTQITRVKLEEKNRVIVLKYLCQIHRYEFLMRVAVTVKTLFTS